MTFKLEAGKFYKTRSGKKVGPIYNEPHHNSFWPFKSGKESSKNEMWYKDDGFSCPGSAVQHKDADDLVEVLRDEAIE